MRLRIRRPLTAFLGGAVALLLAADVLLVLPRVRARLGLVPPREREIPEAGPATIPLAEADPEPAPVAAEPTPVRTPAPALVAAPPAPAPTAAAAVATRPTPVAARAELPAAGTVRHPSLDGPWNLSVTIDESRYAPYRHLVVGYELRLTQTGSKVTGRGRKVSENGRPLRGSARTPIVLDGRVNGHILHATYVLEGRRRSHGTFTWTVAPGADAFQGPFTSDVAGSRGHSSAFRAG